MKEKFELENIFGKGIENTAYAEYFIGKSYLNPLPVKALNITNVTFEAGCRNNWHIHKATAGGGQILLCIAGEGWYQEENKPARRLKAGDVVEIPANVKHWHGATKNYNFAHLAIALAGENLANEWCEPVNDTEYNALD